MIYGLYIQTKRFLQTLDDDDLAIFDPADYTHYDILVRDRSVSLETSEEPTFLSEDALSSPQYSPPTYSFPPGLHPHPSHPVPYHYDSVRKPRLLSTLTSVFDQVNGGSEQSGHVYAYSVQDGSRYYQSSNYAQPDTYVGDPVKKCYPAPLTSMFESGWNAGFGETGRQEMHAVDYGSLPVPRNPLMYEYEGPQHTDFKPFGHAFDRKAFGLDLPSLPQNPQAAQEYRHTLPSDSMFGYGLPPLPKKAPQEPAPIIPSFFEWKAQQVLTRQTNTQSLPASYAPPTRTIAPSADSFESMFSAFHQPTGTDDDDYVCLPDDLPLYQPRPRTSVDVEAMKRLAEWEGTWDEEDKEEEEEEETGFEMGKLPDVEKVKRRFGGGDWQYVFNLLDL
ncbi:hypothetical protein BC829DRAFT_72708 [Chytridium lagenaria]|nr:hypothetical protein BC829DRAFT_72708 [Chytridium lagenaria]